VAMINIKGEKLILEKISKKLLIFMIRADENDDELRKKYTDIQDCLGKNAVLFLDWLDLIKLNCLSPPLRLLARAIISYNQCFGFFSSYLRLLPNFQRYSRSLPKYLHCEYFYPVFIIEFAF
jgi:hypothetical protein